jgi:dihydrofolate reductase
VDRSEPTTRGHDHGHHRSPRVHRPRRRLRVAELDLRVRLRPQDGRDAGRADRRVVQHPARPSHVRDVAPAWRDRTVDDDPGAPFFNETEKFVVGSRAPSEEWANTTRLGPYAADAIGRLKEERDGVIYVSGSGQLVRGLLADGLVDELHLFVYPVALGAGEKFWGDGSAPVRLSLATHEVYENGVVHLAYARP